MSKERIINLKVLKDAQKPFTPGLSVDTEIKHMLKLLDIPEEDFFSEDFKPEDYNLTEEDLEHFIEPDIYESRISHDYGLASLVFKFLGGHKVTGEAYDALASHFQPGSIDDGGCGWLV